MKTLVAKLIPLCIVILIMISSCKKKDDGLPAFTHRIIAEKNYYNNVIDGETTYEYTDNRLTAITYEGDYPSEILLSYPDANTIMATGTDIGTVTFKLTNNLVTEVLEGTNYKMTFSYNSGGLVENMKEYEYGASWILSYESTYSYSLGKLVQISETEYGSELNYEDKYTYSYNGEEINEQIHTYKDPGGVWTNCHKYVYTSSNGKISKMTYYYLTGTTWNESGFEEFSYDTYGNLIESSDDGESTYRTEYIYEEGNGNYRQIFEVVEYDYMYPMPNKKSQTPERDFNDNHKFNPRTSFVKKLF